MSTPRIEDTLLQRFLDDDLEGVERDELAALLDDSAADRAELEQLRRVGGLVSAVADEDANRLSEADSKALFEAVMAGLGDAPAGSTSVAADSGETNVDEPGAEAGARKRPKLRLIAGEGLGTLPPRSEKVAFEPKLGKPLTDSLPEATPAKAREAGSKWPGIAAVVALAAAALLAIALRPDDPAPVAEVVVAPTVTEDPVVEVQDEPEVIVAAHQGTEVEEVDFGSNMGTVFQVPGERDVPVAVVWISDEEYVR